MDPYTCIVYINLNYVYVANSTSQFTNKVHWAAQMVVMRRTCCKSVCVLSTVIHAGSLSFLTPPPGCTESQRHWTAVQLLINWFGYITAVYTYINIIYIMWGMVRIKFPVNQGKHPHTPASLFTAVETKRTGGRNCWYRHTLPTT